MEISVVEITSSPYGNSSRAYGHLNSSFSICILDGLMLAYTETSLALALKEVKKNEPVTDPKD